MTGSWAARGAATVRTALRGRHRRARASIALDQAVVSRHLFLAGAVAVDAFPHLRRPCTVEQLAARIDVVPGPRLDGWIALGVAVGELRLRDDHIHLRGYRSKALAEGDRVTTSWYRSLSSFGTGIPLDLRGLLRGEVDRADLAHDAADIAALAELTDPLVHPVLDEVLEQRGPATMLDVGCGDGRLLERALAVRPTLAATGLDQSPTAIGEATARFGPRTGVALVEGWLDDQPELGLFELVSSVNASYYRPQSELPAFVAGLASHVAPGGELLLATAVATQPTGPRSSVPAVDVAAALLDLQLRCQAGELRLPTRDELLAAVRAAGLTLVPVAPLAPHLPYVVVRARRDRAVER